MAKRRNNNAGIDWTKLALAVGLCLGTGFLGSLVTTPSIDNWYQTLNKPQFNPPNWIFAPVWTALFILMGISLYLVWISRSPKSKAAKHLFYLQLCLNVLWSYVFFGMHQPFLAFVDIVALWTAIFLTIKAFVPVSKAASYLLFPYIAWVSFAAFLNLSIVLLN